MSDLSDFERKKGDNKELLYPTFDIKDQSRSHELGAINSLSCVEKYRVSFEFLSGRKR